jgi:hypothetical protein
VAKRIEDVASMVEVGTVPQHAKHCACAAATEDLCADTLLTELALLGKINVLGAAAQVTSGQRFSFEWAVGQWYEGTIIRAGRRHGWWYVRWDDNSRSLVLLGNSNTARWSIAPYTHSSD